MKQIWLIISLVAFTIKVVSGQQRLLKRPDKKSISTTSVDKIISKLMDTAEVTGLCLGIINDNQAAYVKAYGYKNKTKGELNDTATCFYAASLAKPLFAYLVMQLVDQGKIDLDKPIYTYLPKPLTEYAMYRDLAGDDRWKLITARNCLDHTTGFPNWRQLNPRDNQKLEIFFTPGERYAYSGEGLYLLQLVIESITGRQLEDLAQEMIFKPLAMRRTSFLWQPSFEIDYAVGHNTNEDTLQKNKATDANAAGSMETTIADYTRFMEALMKGQRLSHTSKAEMFRSQIGIHTKHEFPSLNNDTTRANDKIELSYGLGWGLFNSAYGRAFFKEGHGNGWQHYTISIPAKKFSLIIMTNSDNGESIFKELVQELSGVDIPWEWEGYFPYRATVKLPEHVLQQFVGEYEGRLKATISLVNGKLKVESETVNLPKTNLYAQNDHHFFLKVMETEIEFIKGADGTVEKAVIDDEGEHYELKKVK